MGRPCRASSSVRAWQQGACVLTRAADGGDIHGDVSEVTVWRFVMPTDDGYALEVDFGHTYFLPVRHASSMDIASATSQLWVVTNDDASATNQARPPRGQGIDGLDAPLANGFRRCDASHRARRGRLTHSILVVACQVAAYSLGDASAGEVLSGLTIDVPNVQFQPNAVRVVSATSAATVLLVGGLDTTSGAAYPGVVAYGTVAAGSSTLSLLGSAVLPSIGSGVVQLSQTSALHAGYVRASTDRGVFKCADQSLAPLTSCCATWCLRRCGVQDRCGRRSLAGCSMLQCPVCCAPQHLVPDGNLESTTAGRGPDDSDPQQW